MTSSYALFGHRIVSPCPLWGLGAPDALGADAPTLTLSLDCQYVSGSEEFGGSSVAFLTAGGEDGCLSLQRRGDDGLTVFIDEAGETCARIDHDLAAGSVAIREDGPINPVHVTSFLVSPFMPLRLRSMMRLFPLHAAVIGMGDKAVAICGPSGAGKTTLALYLREQSHAIIADDMAAIDPNTAMVHHGAAFSRIDPNHPLARQGYGAVHADARLPKQFLDTSDHEFWSSPRALPLAAIFLLGTSDGAQTTAERLRHPHAGIALARNLSGEMFAPPPSARQTGLAAAFGVATRVPVYALHRRLGLEHLEEAAQVIRDIVGTSQ